MEDLQESLDDLRDRARELLSPDPTEVEWAQYEQQDLYREAVLSSLRQDEVECVEQNAETDEDLTEHFHRCCSNAFRLGRMPAGFAQEWRCRGAR